MKVKKECKESQRVAFEKLSIYKCDDYLPSKSCIPQIGQTKWDGRGRLMRGALRHDKKKTSHQQGQNSRIIESKEIGFCS